MAMDKSKIVLIAAIVAIIAFLFLPYVSNGGDSASVFDILTNEYVEVGFMPFLIIASGVLALIGAIKQSKGMMLGGSIAGTALLLADVGRSAEQLGVSSSTLMDSLGVGFWISLIAFIVGIVFSAMYKKVH